ncbi:MAG: carboxypeptidase regulatory-like domain-containing protein [Vicinamibacterales bacterium]
MKTLRTALFVPVLLALTVGLAAAQQQTGEIFGRATDNSGAVLPGVTVTVSGPTLLQPRVVITSETGTYRVPELPVGAYEVRFELPGFQTMVHQDIRITIGFRAQVNGEMNLSTVQETITVTGESPLVDTKETGTKTSFDLETLQNLPSARDPWVMLERAPAIAMDRVNVGGSQSGQQSNYISRGASTGNNKWSIDGVDVTDMSATGASPIYYDFDMLEEMQVTTGGADVTQQTGGVGINLVTKSGTDRFKGSGRFYVTDDKFEADNVTDEIRAAGAGSGAPIQNIKDYGFDVGGPIKKGKAWYWGSYGTQDVKVGVVGFFKNTPTCRPAGVPASQIPLVLDTATLRDCLETDLTTLNNYNWKVQWGAFTNNKITFQNTWAEKVRNARDASDTRPIETTYRQKAVSSEYGKAGWNTGPGPFWKVSDQHVMSDRWLLDATWSHLGNNFALDFHEDSLAEVQNRFETTTGVYGRSFQQSIFLRPTNSFDLTSNYFLPAALGADHAFKFGYRWRSAHSISLNHRGGNTIARFTNGVANSADLYRDGNQVSHLDTHAFYVQDTVTKNRLTLNMGFRVDRQDDSAQASSVVAHPYAPQVLPGIDFPGADAGVVWTDFSPRLGATYDLTGDGRTVLSSSFSIYYGQMAPGQLSNELAATGAVFVRYPWTDLNGDEFVQANELDYSRILSRSAAYDPANPANYLSPGTVDPNLKNDRTREFIVGFDRQLGPQMAIGGSYIWRKYDRFNWQDRVGLTSADYVAVNYQATNCPAGARCDAITYYQPGIPLPSAFVRTNVVDRWRDYNGFELTFQKRYANRWSMNASYAYNDAKDTFDSPASYEDPTCIVTSCPGTQIYAPETSGSGIDNIFTNAKWLVKLGGQYTLPYDINLSGFFNARQGYPFPQSIQTPNRANSAGQAVVMLDPLGDVRLPNLQTLDFRVDKTVRVGTLTLRPSMEIFNLGNVNTELARRRNQNASNANNISGIVSPRVIRFGVRVTW